MSDNQLTDDQIKALAQAYRKLATSPEGSPPAVIDEAVQSLGGDLGAAMRLATANDLHNGIALAHNKAPADLKTLLPSISEECSIAALKAYQKTLLSNGGTPIDEKLIPAIGTLTALTAPECKKESGHER